MKSLVSVIGAIALGTAMPALAGPDWQVIEQGRKAKQAAQDARQTSPQVIKGQCAPGRLVLALDHGPRAQTTPHQNRIREQDQVRNCG